MGASKAKAAGEEAQQQTGSANRGTGSNGTGLVQQVRSGLGIIW